MNKVLFHIPHSSLKIPKKYWNICIKDRKYINKINIIMSDYLTDKLIPEKSHKLIFKYSRLFCDVEKFKDDNKEIMFKKGMGVLYTKYLDEEITIINKKYKQIILKSYYDKYHKKLDKIVTNLLKKDNCIIIDLHSFSNKIVEELFNIKNTPDICIGTNNTYTNLKLLELTINHFQSYGYKVNINVPYEGVIIPNKYINKKEPNLYSIMLEINKRIYLTNQNDFNKLKNCINNYYDKIKLLELD